MLGHDICSQLIFVYVITVSEMICGTFGVDKILLSRCLQKETLFFDIVPTHSTYRTRQYCVSKESQVMVDLFRGQGTNSLATLRYNTFTRKLSLRRRL